MEKETIFLYLGLPQGWNAEDGKHIKISVYKKSSREHK